MTEPRNAIENATHEEVVAFAEWLLHSRDIALSDVMRRLREFGRANYDRGLEAVAHVRRSRGTLRTEADVDAEIERDLCGDDG